MSIILPVDGDYDYVVVDHWRRLWLENLGNQTTALSDNFEQITLNFIKQARERLDYQTFTAFENGQIVGSVSCQKWIAANPNTVSNLVSEIGVVWAVYVRPEYRRKGVAFNLMRHVKSHWRKIGCKKGILIYASDAGQRVYSRVGFKSGEFLLLDLKPTCLEKQNEYEISQYQFENLNQLDQSKNLDQILDIVSRSSSLEFGTPAKVFSIKNGTKGVIASVVVRQWMGSFPLVLKESFFKMGTLSHFSVNGDKNSGEVQQAIKLLLNACHDYWIQSGCLRACILSKPEHVDIFKQYGFSSSNGMVTDLYTDEESQIIKQLNSFSLDETTLTVLPHALPQQLKAVFPTRLELQKRIIDFQKRYGFYVDPENNWLTKNLQHLGKNFNLTSLRETGKLADKFDRLASRYLDWSVGNKSQVERWISNLAKQYFEELSNKEVKILDAACGIGLMSQQLRLTGYNSQIIGIDISSKMLELALDRGNLDGTGLIDLNCDGCLKFLPENSFDLVICTGAMELLDISKVLGDFYEILKPLGKLWVSFQAKECDFVGVTSHQNVSGLSFIEVVNLINCNNLRLVSLELNPQAYFTPKEGKLYPVPYYFLCCEKI